MAQNTELITIKFFITTKNNARELVYGCKFSASFLCTIPWFKSILNKGSLESQKATIEAEHPTFLFKSCSQYMQHLNWRKNNCLGPDPCLSCDCYVASLALYFDDKYFFCPIMKEGKIVFTQEIPVIVKNSPYYWKNIAFTYHPKILPSLHLPMRLWNQEGKNRTFIEIKKHFEELKTSIKNNLQEVTITPSSWSASKDYLSMWNPVNKDAIRDFIEKKHNKWNQENPDLPPRNWEDDMKADYQGHLFPRFIKEKEELFDMFTDFEKKGTLFEPKYIREVDFIPKLVNKHTEVDHWNIRNENNNSLVLVKNKVGMCSINLSCEGSFSIKRGDNFDDDKILSFDLEQREYTMDEIRDDFPLYLPEDVAIQLCENYPIIIASEYCSPHRRLARFASRHPPIGRYLWDNNKEALCELFNVPKKSYSRIISLDFDDLFKYADSIAKTSSTDVTIMFKDIKLQEIDNLISDHIKNITRETAHRGYEQRLRELEATVIHDYEMYNIIKTGNKKIIQKYKNEEKRVLWDLQTKWWERYEVLLKNYKK